MEKDAINLTLKHEWMTVSDARLLLLDAYLRFKNNKKYGLATQCIGLGQGIATVLENIN